MIEGNDDTSRKKLQEQWATVNTQIVETERNIYSLLQNPDGKFGVAIKAQQTEVLRQQVLVDQRAAMERQLAIAIGVSQAKKNHRSFYPGP